MSEDVADALIDALASEGEHVDDGAFTIDAAEAYRKLREHQLADPHAYILLLVEAAWLAGQGRPDMGVRIELGAITTVEFRGHPLELGSLGELFAAALGGGRQPEADAPATELARLRRAQILKLLGLAANNALALEPDELILDASDGDGNNRRVRIDPNGQLDIEPVQSIAPNMVRFQLRGGSEWKRPRAENELLVERCRYSSFPIYVGGVRVSLGPGADLEQGRKGSPITTAIEQLGESIGVAGQTKDRATPTVAWFVNRGVAIRNQIRGEGVGKRAVVEVDLPMDLSHERLVEGPVVDAIRAEIEAALERVPTRKPPPSAASAKPVGWGTWLLFAVLGLFAALVWLEGYEKPTDKVMNNVWKCDAGSIEACKRVLADPDSASRDRLTALERTCEAGDKAACKERYPPKIDVIACYRDDDDDDDDDDHGACARAGKAEPDPLRRDPLFRRGCVIHEDEAACAAMVSSAREASVALGDLDLLRIALTRSCLSISGPDCVEAAWFYRYGFIRPPHIVDIDELEDPDATEAQLLERGCAAKIAKACELRSAPTLAVACADTDALACYAIANELQPESLAAADRACTLGLMDGCWAAGMMHARGLTVDVDRDAALRNFNVACDSGHEPSCASAKAISWDQPLIPSFPSWVPPAGATP
jgi:hypothetical protein